MGYNGPPPQAITMGAPIRPAPSRTSAPKLPARAQGPRRQFQWPTHGHCFECRSLYRSHAAFCPQCGRPTPPYLRAPPPPPPPPPPVDVVVAGGSWDDDRDKVNVGPWLTINQVRELETTYRPRRWWQFWRRFEPRTYAVDYTLLCDRPRYHP